KRQQRRTYRRKLWRPLPWQGLSGREMRKLRRKRKRRKRKRKRKTTTMWRWKSRTKRWRVARRKN
ncbi:hypothetical protein LTR33_014609, partial [Friedmanniomyces endolithicus]